MKNLGGMMGMSIMKILMKIEKFETGDDLDRFYILNNSRKLIFAYYYKYNTRHTKYPNFRGMSKCFPGITNY